MKLTANQLRQIVKEELAKSKKASLLPEGHSRITAEEVEAWKKGDWGFVSESESDSYDEASAEEMIGWCAGIIRDPDTSQEKIKEVLGLLSKDSLKKAYNILAKNPMGDPQPGLSDLPDLLKTKFLQK